MGPCGASASGRAQARRARGRAPPAAGPQAEVGAPNVWTPAVAADGGCAWAWRWPRKAEDDGTGASGEQRSSGRLDTGARGRRRAGGGDEASAWPRRRPAGTPCRPRRRRSSAGAPGGGR